MKQKNSTYIFNVVSLSKVDLMDDSMLNKHCLLFEVNMV